MRRTLFLLLLLLPAPAWGQEDRVAKIENALRAAPQAITVHATVMDWDGKVLREGTNGWTCLPDPPQLEDSPMCLDAEWMKWAEAWQRHETPELSGLGIGYMLVGDAGASNTDPYAEGPTDANEWVESGPHLMILTADPAELETLPTDPTTGGPWVMWKGTPYVHVMVPVPGLH